MAQNPNPSLLDQQQILQRVFDGTNDKLRVDSSISVTTIAGEVNVELSAADGDNVAISDGTDTLAVNSDGSINITDNGGSLTVDGSVNAVQSGTWNINNISGTISLPTGASTSALQTTGNTSLSSIDSKTPALVSGRQPVDGSGVTQPISATSLPLPTGASTAANQTTANTSLASIDAGIPAALGQTTMAASMPVTIASNQTDLSVKGPEAVGATPAVNPVQDSGVDINGKIRRLLTDESGALVISPLHSSGGGMAAGGVTTAATTKVPVYKTAYTEQTADGQRSIASSDVNDTAAGLGARQVTISYLPLGGGSLKTEVLTLNGVTAVNTVNTDICYIEKIEVTSAGLAATNFGVISLYTGINATGSVFGSIAIQDNHTFWAHHYVPAGKTCRITGVTFGNTSITAGAGALFQIEIKRGFLGITNIIDNFRLYGQSSSTVVRPYTTPIPVVGTAFKVLIYVTPDNATSNTQYATIEWAEF